MASILILDDEPQIVQHLKVLLAGFGYHAGFITKPEFLFQRLAVEEFDLLLMDLHMPGWDGLTLLRQLKSEERYQNLPVIMITGEIDERLLAKCFEEGASDFINKPISEIVLKSRVHAVLTSQRYIREVQSQKDTVHQLLQKQIRQNENYGKLVQFIDDIQHDHPDSSILRLAEEHLQETLGIQVQFWELFNDRVIPLGKVDRDLSEEKCSTIQEVFQASSSMIFRQLNPKYIKDGKLLMEILHTGPLDDWIDLLPLYIRNIHLTLTSNRQHRAILKTQSMLRLQNQWMQSDLRMAKEMQQAILHDLQEMPFLATSMLYLPHGEVSGDIYDVSATREGDLNMFLGDATGHGIPAAFITMMVRMGLATLPPNLPTDEVIRRLNQQLAPCLPPDKYMTAIYVRIAPNGYLSVCHAGHPMMFVIPNNEEPPYNIEPSGLALGIYGSELVQYREQVYRLVPGDRIFLYTDGIVEWLDPHENTFGEERFHDFLCKHRHLPFAQLWERLLEHLKGFGQGNVQGDDITIFAAQFLGKE